MPRLTAFELRLFFQGLPTSPKDLPHLDDACTERILAAFSMNLGAGKLNSEIRWRLLRQIAYAQVAYNHVTNGDQSVSLIWTKKDGDELKRPAESARQLSAWVKQCSFSARTRFGHTGIDGTSYRKLRSLVDQVQAITDGAYRLKPKNTPSRRGDLPFNVLVSLLAMAWERATRTPVTRSTKQTKTPLPFIQAVLEEIGVKKNHDAAIQSALRWFTRRRAHDRKFSGRFL
jgi:hypothetical protein